MHNNENIFCRICGYKSIDPPWSDDSRTPLYDYCPCCGVEHGYQDASLAGAKKYRAAWISAGAAWECQNVKPAHWDFEEQLKHVPMAYR
jgi:hypothetical protein